MSGILLVARRDFAAYVNTLWGWGVLALALVFDGLFFNAWGLSDKPQYSAEVLQSFFFVHGGVTLVAGVFITMRLFAEERQTGTIVLLETSPLTETQMVLGKYLSAMMFQLVFTALSLYMPLMILLNGKISAEEIAVGYLGTLSMGSAGVAIGTWASSMARNQLLAGVIAAVTTVFFVACWILAKVVDAPYKAIVSYMAFFENQFKPFQTGTVHTSNLVFFASLTFAFLLLSTRSLAARRWE
jgi:ABC-2 type transport system permease protein